MALNIEAMRQKLANSQNKNAGKNSGTKWRPQEGDQTIRILPTADGDPFKEFHFHYMLEKIRAFYVPRKTMENIVLSAISPLNYGEKELTTTMINPKTQQRSCLHVSVIIHQS